MKKGLYFIGDPEVIIDPKFLDEFLNTFVSGKEGVFVFRGFEVFVTSIESDGIIIYDNYGKEYTIESGTIGAIPMDAPFINTLSKDELNAKGLVSEMLSEFDGSPSISGMDVRIGSFMLNEEIKSLPSGNYFIGDPCYIVKDELWNDFCTETFKNDDGGYFMFKGVKMFFSGTKYGDGCYSDEHGNTYGVDAGIIGATLLDDRIIDKENLGGLSRLGLVVEITKDFTCEAVNEEGYILIERLKIDTGDASDKEGYEECMYCGEQIAPNDECECPTCKHCDEKESECTCDICPECEELVGCCMCDKEEDY